MPLKYSLFALIVLIFPHYGSAQRGVEFNADIHAHISLKPYNRGYGEGLLTADLWNEHSVLAPKVSGMSRLMGVYNKVPSLSCSNLNNMAKGNVRLVFASVCPIQREFTQNRFVSKLIMWNRLQWKATLAFFSGANLTKIKDLQNDDVDYFKETLNELNLIAHLSDSISPDGRYQYKVVHNFEEVKQIIAYEPNSIAVVLNIEGGHGIGTGIPSTLKMQKDNPEALNLLVSKNISTLKQNYSLFSIGLANHFWNQLCGQTRTNNRVMSTFINESEGQNVGITPAGYVAISELLSTENGHRVLIDVKHMSLQSRLDYYDLLKTKYNNSVPILYSHGGVSGISSSLNEFRINKKGEEKFLKDKMKDNKKSYLHQWSFNLYDDEIRIIHQSRGLIGIMLEDTRLGGQEAIGTIKKTVVGSQQQKDEYLKLFLANAFHIVKTIGDKSAWDIIALGSDFDGAINPMNTYQDASRITEFRKDMADFLTRVKSLQLVLDERNYIMNNAEIIALLYDYSPYQIAEKIMSKNTFRFMSENF